MRQVDFIIIHCSATDAHAKTMDIISYWKTKLGWEKMGYHQIVDEDGKVTRLTDDEEIANGVHGYNHNSIHICYKGGKNGTDTRTHAQKKSILDELMLYRKKYPKAKIKGHRDLSRDLNGDGKITPDEWVKLCPCFNAALEYGNI